MTHTSGFKLLLPLAFFGYAGFANVTLFLSDVDRPDVAGFFQGAFTKEVDTLYRANLPHREPAVGWIGAARYVLLNEGRSGVVAGDEGWLFTSEETRTFDPEAASVAEALQWIAEVDTLLTAMGSTLIVVPVPKKLAITDPDALHDAIDTHAWTMEALAAADIATVDITEVLARLDQPYFRTDTHWTAEGAAAAAEAVAASGHVPLGTTAFNRQDSQQVTFTGDLVSFVTSDTLAPAVGLPQEIVTPYLANPVDTGGTGAVLDLFGSSGPAPAVLVGTSYSANPNWSFVEALKLSLGHDILNYAQEGRGPIVPMRDFLEQVDRDAPPPFVIWEFPVRFLSDPALMDMTTPDSEGGNA